MKNRAALLVVFVLFTGCPHKPAGDASDEKQIEGEWLPVHSEQGGEVVPQDVVKKHGPKIRIAGGKFDTIMEGRTQQVSFTINPGQNPKEITTVDLDGPGEGKVTFGIDLLDGNRLTMCVRNTGEGRPTEFTKKLGSDDMLIVFERAK